MSNSFWHSAVLMLTICSYVCNIKCSIRIRRKVWSQCMVLYNAPGLLLDIQIIIIL
ncbi:hypothetical protein IFM89_008590 [Coptis chinensis]|uniref:Uncharacterized protein n=1 Tax=Coptis chinensis TaxID=261450 RepID=A0A835LUT8_9MAGN|nr:hypothetical protein IFM89_008590 [Coptis chinensis]